MALSLVAVVTAIVAPVHAQGDRVRGPFLLVSLASLGTVTWRCDRARRPGLALGFDSFTASADLTASLRASGRTVTGRHVAPGEVVAFPFLRAPIQRLELIQGTGAGTLRATITVDFAARSTPSHCWPYAPPKTDVALSTRL